MQLILLTIVATIAINVTKGDVLAMAEGVTNSINSIILDERCETQTSNLWAESTLQVRFPSISSEEFSKICREDSKQNLQCDLSLRDMPSSFSDLCESSGGKIIDIDLTMGEACYDSDSLTQSTASFRRLNICAGNNCEDEQFHSLLLLKGIFNRTSCLQISISQELEEEVPVFLDSDAKDISASRATILEIGVSVLALLVTFTFLN